MKGIYICLVIIYLLKLKIAECLPKFWEKRCPRISYKAADCNILQAPWSFVCIHQNLEEHFNWCVIRKKKLDLVFKEIHFSFLLFNVCFEKENYEVCCQVILGGKKMQASCFYMTHFTHLGIYIMLNSMLTIKYPDSEGKNNRKSWEDEYVLLSKKFWVIWSS